MKIDCSNILNFKKEYKRMCCYKKDCKHCPLDTNYNTPVDCSCGEIKLHEITEEILNAVQKWSDEHPQKTLLEDLLEKYPTVPLDKDNVPDNICPNNLGYENYEDRPCDTLYCTECWNRTLDEVEE